MTHSNGQEVIDYFDKLFQDINKKTQRPIQPVSLLLLDINMPILDGMETCKRVKMKFEEFNKVNNDKSPIIRPLICYFSAYNDEMMKSFINEDEKADCYIEKPLPINELISLLRIINIC